jgi:hypothetical protein
MVERGKNIPMETRSVQQRKVTVMVTTTVTTFRDVHQLKMLNITAVLGRYSRKQSLQKQRQNQRNS